MKLAKIPSGESTVKHSFAFKQSTTELLSKYQTRYKSVHGVDVALKDMVELMVLTFMTQDKAFQKSTKPEIPTNFAVTINAAPDNQLLS